MVGVVNRVGPVSLTDSSQAAIGSAVIIAFAFGEAVYRQRDRPIRALFFLTSSLVALAVVLPVVMPFDLGSEFFFAYFVSYFVLLALVLSLLRKGSQGDIHHFAARLFIAALLGSITILVAEYYDPPLWLDVSAWVVLLAMTVGAWLAILLLTRNNWVRAGVVLLALAVYVGTFVFGPEGWQERAAAYVILLGIVPIAYLLFSGALRVTSARQGDAIDANLASAWIAEEHQLQAVRPAAQRQVPGRRWRRWMPFGVSEADRRDLRSLATFRAVQRLPRAATSGPLKDFFSELLDFDEPPLFKNFLKFEVAGGVMTISCYGITGWTSDLADLPVEDSFQIGPPGPMGDPE